MGVKVRERPKDSGVWWVFVDQRGMRKAKKCGPKKLANKVAEIMEANLKLGRPLLGKEEQPPLPTLKQYYERFKETYMETTLKPSTFKSYEMSFRVHILPELGSYRLDQIDREKVEDFISKLTKKKVKKGSDETLAQDSIRLILAALGIMCRRAVKHKLVAENPATDMGEFYRQIPKRHEEIEPLSESEALLFLSTTLDYAPQQFPLFLCALHTGMRSGELAGLQWGDIDWNGRFIDVRRQYVRGQITSLKSATTRRQGREGAMRRKVDCSDDLLDALRRHKSTCQQEWLKKGQNEAPEWIFATSVGTPADMYNIKQRYFKTVLKKAGLRSIRFHDLRHTYASLLLSKGEPVLYVSNQLGHSNPQFTMKIYAHWIPNKSQREAVNKLPSLGTIVAKEATN